MLVPAVAAGVAGGTCTIRQCMNTACNGLTHALRSNQVHCPLPAGHVIPGLVHKCYLAKQKGEPFTIMGSGKPL